MAATGKPFPASTGDPMLQIVNGGFAVGCVKQNATACYPLLNASGCDYVYLAIK